MQRQMRRAFTLIEICIAIALLGMLAGIVGWHLKSMVGIHNFRKHVSLFVTNLQKLQIVALSRRCDLTVSLYQREGKWFYMLKSDEPMTIYGNQREVFLEGVHSISENGNLELTISPAGRIEPLKKIGFFHQDPKEEDVEKIWLDLTTPPQLSCS